MHQSPIEALPLDIWYTILRHLDLTATALLALCSKTIYHALEGPKILKQLGQSQDDHYRHRFLLTLEQDLPIDYLYCSADVKFHYARIDALDPFVTFPHYSRKWRCAHQDFRNETSFFLGPGLPFHQARMLLKLFERQHPLAQKYLDTFSLCQVKKYKPCSFLQRELQVKWVPGYDRPSLFARIQHWFLRDTQSIRKQDPVDSPFPGLFVCYHHPRESPRTGTFSTACVARGSSPLNSIFRCCRCATEFRLDQIELLNPPRLYLSSYLPLPMGGRRVLNLATCITKWMNLGTLETQSASEWRRFAYVSNKDRSSLRGFCSSNRAFEFFEGEEALASEQNGKEAYKPVWTKHLERKVKNRLMLEGK